MPANVDYQRQLHRQAYGASMVANLERLATAKSEYIRLNALKKLARIIGIVSLLPQLHDLALNARSESIGYRATIIIIDYLQLGSDEAADNRPEPLSLDLNEQLAVQQQRRDTADPLSHPQPPAPINYTADYLDPPLDAPYHPAAATQPAIATPDAAAATPADDQPDQPANAGDTIDLDQITADNTAPDQAEQPAGTAATADQPEQPTDAATAADQPEQPAATAAAADQPEQPEQSDNDPDPDPDDPVAAYETDEIKHLFEQGERLAERLNRLRDAADHPLNDHLIQPDSRPPPT